MGFLSKLASALGFKKHHTYYNIENDLSADEIQEQKEQIISLLKSTERKGMNKIISYMNKNDFFNMPSSVHKHHNFRGGLAQHVLSVYNLMKEEAPELPDESVIIAAILHDLCKADLFRYQRDGGLRRNHGKSQRRGFKSIKIISDCGLEITESERLAIRWHMGDSNARTRELDDADKARRDKLAVTLFKCNREDSLNG